MKKSRFFTLLVALATAIPMWGANEGEDEEKYPEITFQETTIDFGLFDREHGDKVCWFRFKNTGEKDLLILSANSTCGCTEAEAPKNPIKPGMQDSIKVTYKGSTRRVGKLKRVVVLTTNCKVNSAYIYITGEMVEELVADRVKPEEEK